MVKRSIAPAMLKMRTAFAGKTISDRNITGMTIIASIEIRANSISSNFERGENDLRKLERVGFVGIFSHASRIMSNIVISIRWREALVFPLA
jgi:hypothetical protein